MADVTNAEFKAVMARQVAKDMFRIAKEQDLNMAVLAEEAIVLAMATLTGRDPESVRGEVFQAFKREIEKAKGLLDTKPAGEA